MLRVKIGLRGTPVEKHCRSIFLFCFLTREVRGAFVKHVGEAEVLEGIVQLVGRLDLELGNVDVVLGRAAERQAGKVEVGLQG